jgi:hypothetical protein
MIAYVRCPHNTQSSEALRNETTFIILLQTNTFLAHLTCFTRNRDNVLLKNFNRMLHLAERKTTEHMAQREY